MDLEKIRIFFARHKIWKTILVLVGVSAILYGFNCFYCYYYSNNPEATISVVGTLLGAVVGGVLTLWGSIIINSRAQKAANAIRRKNEIYKPLYDELKEIHDEILKDEPCPKLVAFKKEPQTTSKYPQYTVWGEIKKEARFFEVPSELKNAMEELYSAIHLYQEKRRIVVPAFDRIYMDGINKISKGKMQGEAHNGEEFLMCVLIDNPPCNNDLMTLLTQCSVDIDESWSELTKMAYASDEFKQFIAAKSNWNVAEEKALHLLEKLIRNVVRNYEK